MLGYFRFERVRGFNLPNFSTFIHSNIFVDNIISDKQIILPLCSTSVFKPKNNNYVLVKAAVVARRIYRLKFLSDVQRDA